LQTVEPGNTPFLRTLLAAIHERTGIPVLLNTSPNGPGDPLTESPEDSIATRRKVGQASAPSVPSVAAARKRPHCAEATASTGPAAPSLESRTPT
jgi:carbamoyltransferase